jgi:uncharacterized membrane protein
LKPVTRLDTHENTVDPTTSGPEQSYLSAQIKQQIDAGHPAISLNEDNEGRSKISKISEASVLDETRGAGIELTREISFVMDTLTDKEQSILRALLKRGGTMTQTEMRYELDISKSSLSGILTSMEKRKIITKQEKGRTNVIELSELFLNTQERS